MPLDHLDHLRRDAHRLADIVAASPPDAEVPGCPGWTLRDVAGHTGFVHRWAREALLTAAPPQIDPAADPVPDQPAGVADWLRAGAERLLASLAAADPTAPTWHPFPVEPKVAGLWRRRQSQETFVHRLDAEMAVGVSSDIDAELAADGVDEYWTVMLPRMLSREKLTPPASVLRVRLTDQPGEWTVDGASGTVVLAGSGVTAPAATLSGTAADMLLRLWGRPVAPDAIAVEGDAQVAAAWLALGGA